jgi:ABC-type glycerol-3-phosphate transport system permease component
LSRPFGTSKHFATERADHGTSKDVRSRRRGGAERRELGRSVDTAKVLAFTSLSMIPALVFFSLFERRIVGGLTGAVKG